MNWHTTSCVRPATSGVLRYKRNATQNVVLRRKDRRQLFQIRALLKEEQNSRSYQFGYTQHDAPEAGVPYIGTADLMLPLVCQIHHMLRQKSLKEAYDDSEDFWHRRHEFLWRLEKHERQQKEETRVNKEKKSKQQGKKTETEAVEIRTDDEKRQVIVTSANHSNSSELVEAAEVRANEGVEGQVNRRRKQTEQESEKHVRHHIATSANRSNSSELKKKEQKEKERKQVEEQMIATSANRSNSSELRKKEQKKKEGEIDGLLPVEDGEEEGNITLPNLLREPPGLEQKKEERLVEGTQKGKGANLYGAVKRSLTPTPAKFRICSDSDTDNSSTLNSDVSAPSHWWHESTSPSKRSQDQKRLNDDRLSRFKMGTPEQEQSKVKDEISGIAPEDRNLQCPDQSILNRFFQNTVISPCSRRIRPNSGLLEIQTDYSIEMEQPIRWGMGTE